MYNLLNWLDQNTLVMLLYNYFARLGYTSALYSDKFIRLGYTSAVYSDRLGYTSAIYSDKFI